MLKISQDDARAAIEKFMKANNLQQTAWSREANVNEATLRSFLKGRTKTMPRYDTLDKLASAAGTTVEQMLGVASATPSQPFQEPSDTKAADKRVPVIGYTGPDGKYGLFYGNPCKHVLRIDPIVDVANAFAAYVMDDTMELRYSKGDIVYINPSQPVRQGNSALIELTDGSARIGRVAAIDGEGNVTLQFLNVADSDHFKEYPASQVKNIHRIVGALEV
ncbi:MAG: hypothetical protein JKY47_02335 [Thalassospira sp.]|nr:hypothetical protein [Thalassospira sp.]